MRVALKTRCACFFLMLSKLVSASQCLSSHTGIDKFVECANHVRVVICPEECVLGLERHCCDTQLSHFATAILL